MDMKRIDLALKLLNEVETHGAMNLNNLLGAIQLIEGFKKETISLPSQEGDTKEV